MKDRPRRPAPRAAKRPAPPAARPVTRAQWAVVLAAAAVIAMLGVSYRIYDPDLWQHLAVGRSLWRSHAIPHTDVWTWPTYGAPYVLPSWLFRALVWPFYAAGGAWGLAVWRWGTTLAAFGIALATARRMGARGLTAVIAVTWCALLYRQRSMGRPETLASVLLATQMWILESRRRGGRDRSIALVPLTWLWANAHVSWYLPLLLTGFHVLAESLGAARGVPGARPPWRLAGILAASAVACLVNPFGWAALAQPFEYLLFWRHQPLFRMILELGPIVWPAHALDGLAIWMVLAAALAVARVVRGRGDLADLLTYALCFGSALTSQRFLGFLAVAAAPIFARDLSEWTDRWSVPRALRPGWVRAGVAVAALTLGAVPQLTVEPWRPGPGIAWSAFPVRACDWIERHGVRGRMFGAFHQAGYQLWRFWPQRDRLPFMDIHQTGTRADQDLYAACWADDRSWKTLDAKYRFDWVLLPRAALAGQDLIDRLDADTTTWALVFADDAAALDLRRDGPLAGLADGARYTIVPAGERAIPRLNAAFASGAEGRRRMRAELERQARESEWTWRAHSALATLDLAESRWADALTELERTREIEPHAPLLAERLRSARDSLAAPRP